MTPPLALYIHIPFCAARCAYCDFNTYAGLEALYEPYTAALLAEIRRAGEAAGRPGVHTIFIGGGTPTVLPPYLLAQILDACRAAFDVAAGAEITSEANPGSFTTFRTGSSTALRTVVHAGRGATAYANVRSNDFSRSANVRSNDFSRSARATATKVATTNPPVFRTVVHAGRGATADESSRGGSHAAGASGMGARPAIFRTDTVDQPRFAALREMGVNRLSLGVQSFDDAELRWLGRIHTAAEAEAAFHAARAAGFDNVSLDFIFGLPGQEPTTWAQTLARAVSLAPEHLSLYSLTVEHGTPLAEQVRRGLVPAPDDDLTADLYDLACDALAKGGYEQYEISNWARGISEWANGRMGEWANGRISKSANRKVTNQPSAISHQPSASSFQLPASSFQPPASSFQCRHNLVYWRREPYLGFGPGAHSFVGERRWWNVRSVPAYIRRIGEGQSPEEGSETIERRLAMGETMMLGLRLVQEGVTGARFQERFGVGLEEAFGREIHRLVARGLLERLPDRVRLTPAARLVGNRVFAEFLP